MVDGRFFGEILTRLVATRPTDARNDKMVDSKLNFQPSLRAWQPTGKESQKILAIPSLREAIASWQPTVSERSQQRTIIMLSEAKHLKHKELPKI